MVDSGIYTIAIHRYRNHKGTYYKPVGEYDQMRMVCTCIVKLHFFKLLLGDALKCPKHIFTIETRTLHN